MRTPAVITVATSSTVSAGADVGPGCEFFGLEMPAAYTAGNLTFQGSVDGGTTYGNIVDDAGSDVTLTGPAAGETIIFRDTIFQALKMFRHIKVVAQNGQAADRTFQLLSRLK